MEATGTPIQYTFTIIDSEHSDANPEPVGNSKQFNGHTVSVRSHEMRAINTIGDDCVVCGDTLEDDGFRFPKPLSELGCGHLMHTDCINRCRDVNPVCPLCTLSCKKYSDPKVHSYREGMILSLPAQCSGATCEIESVGQAVRVGCPYPVSIMSLNQPGYFIKENKQVLIEWLKKYFTAQGYPHSEIISSENPNQLSEIVINVKRNANQLPQQLFYSDADINGLTTGQCFDSFTKDVKTDKLFLDLREKCPQFFDIHSELFINGWHFHQDVVNFSNGVSISLSQILNPAQNEIDIGQLMSELGRHCNDLDKLINPSPRAPVAYNSGRQPSGLFGSSSTPVPGRGTSATGSTVLFASASGIQTNFALGRRNENINPPGDRS